MGAYSFSCWPCDSHFMVETGPRSYSKLSHQGWGGRGGRREEGRGEASATGMPGCRYAPAYMFWIMTFGNYVRGEDGGGSPLSLVVLPHSVYKVVVPLTHASQREQTEWRRGQCGTTRFIALCMRHLLYNAFKLSLSSARRK